MDKGFPSQKLKDFLKYLNLKSVIVNVIKTKILAMALDELRVWVEGDERVIRGVNENTTSENVMVALASATGKSGKFALLEKWRNFERILPRNGKPLMCLRMWGTHCNEVEFILKDNSDNSLKGHVVESLKHEINDTSSTRDLSQMSYHRSSLETFQLIQARRLELLARDLEIMKQYSDYFRGGNSYSSFSEEIENDLTAKLTLVIKLQLNELSENEDCKRELERLRSEERRVGKECRSRWSPYH